MTVEQDSRVTTKTAGATNAVGGEVQDVLFDIMMYPAAVQHTRLPWYAEVREAPIARDKRKQLTIVSLRVLVDILMFLCAARLAY